MRSSIERIKHIKSLSKEEAFKEDPTLTEELYNKLKASKSGHIEIHRKKDLNGGSGYTPAFGEGISCYISSPDNWYFTSTIKSIDWENKEFTTLNSVYNFTFTEDDCN